MAGFRRWVLATISAIAIGCMIYFAGIYTGSLLQYGQTRENTDIARHALPGIPGLLARELKGPAPNSAYEIGVRELAAQEATSALGLWGLLLAAAGTAAVVWQMILTRRALNVARETAHRDLRAYVNIESIDAQIWTSAENWIWIETTVTLRNNGKTPAILENRIVGAAALSPKAHKTHVVASGPYGAPVRQIIAPGATHHMKVKGGMAPSPRGTVIAWAGASYKYRDHLGRLWHETEWWRSEEIDRPSHAETVEMRRYSHVEGNDGFDWSA